jgi:hypothetical protein
MPIPRVMGDMLILPTGEILIINGAKQGTAGWGNARTPVLTPVLYNPTTNRYQVMRATTIPRLYHSSAVVLPSGEIFVGGSNPNEGMYSLAFLSPQSFATRSTDRTISIPATTYDDPTSLDLPRKCCMAQLSKSHSH